LPSWKKDTEKEEKLLALAASCKHAKIVDQFNATKTQRLKAFSKTPTGVFV
jgi:hypothetical protein